MAFGVIDGKRYLNYNDSIRAQWLSGISGYIRKADVNWPAAMNFSNKYR